MRIVRKERPKHDDGDLFYVQHRENLVQTQTTQSLRRRIIPYLIFGVIVASGTVFVKQQYGTSLSDARSIVQALQGKKALSEGELRDLVASQKLNVYWVGSRENTKYVLSSYPDGKQFVRYLPAGKGLSDLAATYIVVATYPLKSAFNVGKSAAKAAKSAGFINIDGHAISYTSDHPGSVYIGLKKADFQVEIFDPVPGLALVSASTAGLIRKIE